VAVDRLPIRFTAEGAANLTAFVKRFVTIDRPLVEHVLGELATGYPLRDAPVSVDVIGGLRWDIPHPSTFRGGFEIEPGNNDGDIDPLAMCAFGWIEFWYRNSDSAFPESCFVCDGLREARADFLFS
jgi:hypothetical protein